MDTMCIFDSINEQRTLRTIYDYCHQNFLTNPECSFVSEEGQFSDCKTYGSSHDKRPENFEGFRADVKKEKWDVCLCVAGTDARDSRRVVLTYMKEMKKVIVNFASATNGMSLNEKNIKEWLTANLSM